MPINSNYKKPEIVAGALNTPVTFFEFKPAKGPDPGEVEKKELYKCTCLAYNPSSKDREILSAKGTKEAITIKIRDPYTDYLPSNKHKVILDDFRYKEKIWEVVDFAPDLENNQFLKIILGVTS
ncbi:MULTISPECIES: phage head-tail adapter protein [unclassified Enterococcus]|uniref:phage head-tail adapter protein n=1 Tax=unclassified Enterococcus TaxID=2608891 RepID=UPI001552E74F|nr:MULTISPECIES: phage head-tail adapter protein [unclassified Enterococcus]MBS7578295.1 phage head-tail adapter protein [Enterococcus sp. MMGLQ5-2]MBS7585494.1 phage head-tail adapter protein [Enterococcus sp. MMGLQ5-1]NPD13351.1 phage head-tail adapter protein [Enterococcus sp. MMGLQ5-1]NPD38126.1 phage head-tail adapter protein [Enterococcus sp. MMGLQ5-2]